MKTVVDDYEDDDDDYEDDDDDDDHDNDGWHHGGPQNVGGGCEPLHGHCVKLVVEKLRASYEQNSWNILSMAA